MNPKVIALVLLAAWNVPRIGSVTEKSHSEKTYSLQSKVSSPPERGFRLHSEGETENETISSLEVLNNSAEIEDIADKKESDQLAVNSSGLYSDKIIDRKGKNVYQDEQDLLDSNKLFGRKKSFFEEFTHIFDHFNWNFDMINRAGINDSCKLELNEYLNALKQGSKPWAFKVSDASGKYRGTYLFENDFWLGSKQFCDEIGREKSDNGEIPELQFFVVRMITNLIPLEEAARIVHVGQCLPKACSSSDVLNILNADPALIRLRSSFSDLLNAKAEQSQLTLVDCRAVPGSFNYLDDPKFYLIGFLFLTAILLVICAAFYENYLSHASLSKDQGVYHIEGKMQPRDQNGNESCELNNIGNHNYVECVLAKPVRSKRHDDSIWSSASFASKLLLCFSHRINLEAIFNTGSSTENSLRCIHGIRLLTLLWTILVHTYIFYSRKLQMFAIGENKFTRKIAERSFVYQLVGNATFSVDTFFFISGLLVVYLFLKTEEPKLERLKNSRLANFFKTSTIKTTFFICYRFLRLTPIYLIIIVFTEISMKYVYNNSVFSPGLSDHINCNKYWFRNILYVNNFYPLTEICLMWSWYLANDFQLYIVAIVILVLSTRFLKTSVSLGCFLLAASWLISIYISLHHSYKHKVSEPFESFDLLYDKPWQRFGPYVMGMVTGVILHKVKQPPRISSLLNVGAWLASIMVNFIIIFGVTDGQLSEIPTSLYVSFGHTAWGLTLIWIVVSCYWKLAKPIDDFLSFRGFIPLSRLSYCAYLIHPVIMMLTSFQCDGPTHLKHGIILTAFLGNAVLSFIAAFFLSLFFEAPLIKLLKLCFY